MHYEVTLHHNNSPFLYPQLGLGDTLDRGDAGGQMGDALPWVQLPSTMTSVSSTITSSTITSLSTGEHHSCAVQGQGQLRCWGDNAYGEVRGLYCGCSVVYDCIHLQYNKLYNSRYQPPRLPRSWARATAATAATVRGRWATLCHPWHWGGGWRRTRSRPGSATREDAWIELI